jgi:hypothetical protein
MKKFRKPKSMKKAFDVLGWFRDLANLFKGKGEK